MVAAKSVVVAVFINISQISIVNCLRCRLFLFPHGSILIWGLRYGEGHGRELREIGLWVTLARELERPLATPAEARKILGLK